ncbi:MAG TPA: PhaM family polyhydroxyalkanoate granule multifunctional regulatory protein [Ramlibacter sp.]|jgi:hypothetical protein|uniref:PhaM family polyhydroxyalkanoate granule multifunctional regulatory protein n=1 Tax=Ramlibacter sp. TaxID=1917967 RepID=UPI002D26C415|nr:PhaM family polyhydroxyalkanoate granule multifunctional regulatory protein [Ramlibacter sp.]HZY17058.1 PhaM family polyhydroxyalkanoate granule multifunctional regulatory protein [Ramlibacter sp.]
MSDDKTPGFGQFVPGFDFLQNLAKGASQAVPQMPNLSAWVAPTLNVQELEKRIGEMKAVHFWLEQNSRALGATIQALEVQKMTLATLQGMNVAVGDLAKALTPRSPAGAASAPKAASAPADGAGSADHAGNGKAKSAGPAALVDPMQWWGALTQQFQQIAADAMKDVGRHTGVDAARTMTTGMAQDAMKSAADIMRSASPGSGAKPARKAAAPRKPAAKSAGRKSPAR